MPDRYIARTSRVPGTAAPHRAPIYVDADDNKLKMIPAGSGTTEVEILDASSTQSITGKTISAKTLVTPYTADGAIALIPGIATLSKAGVLAATLAAPAAGDEGLEITIVSLTDNAHTVTVPTDKGNDGTTGINELFTFAAFAGASMTLVAIGTSWYTKALVAVTPTSTV